MRAVRLFAVFGCFTKYEAIVDNVTIPIDIGAIGNKQGLAGFIPLFVSKKKAEEFSGGRWTIQELEILTDGLEDKKEIVSDNNLFRDIEIQKGNS